MSIVAVKKYHDKIVIGADSILVRGWTQEKNKDSKLFKVNDLVFGTVGFASEGAMLLIFSKTHNPRDGSVESILEFMVEFQEYYKNKTGKGDISNSFIFVYQQRIFYCSGFYVKEINDFMAIGAGEDFALAALYLNSSVEDSIKAACHLSVYCEEPINIITIPINK